MKGRKPTPTAVLEMRGSWRAKARKDEPKADKTLPYCPKWLNAAARAVWKKLIPDLAAMGVLAHCDEHVLARYCTLHVMHRAAVHDADANAAVKLSAHMLRIEQEFGMTASARARLATPKDDPKELRGKGRFFSDSGAA